jgi:hypothetical protein
MNHILELGAWLLLEHSITNVTYFLVPEAQAAGVLPELPFDTLICSFPSGCWKFM